MIYSKYSCFLILIFLHQFEGMGAESYYFFRAGVKVTLPCEKAVTYGPECSEVIWLHYYKKDSQAVRTGGPSSSRVSLAQNCSLTLHNVTDQDAGQYVCRLGGQSTWHTTFYLGVLNVSEAPPGSNHSPSSLTVQCSVSRFFRQCRDGSILWSDHKENITANVTQTNCVSYLTVERRCSRTFTCRYHNAKKKVSISADYTPGVRSKAEIDHFSRAGENITLPCQRVSHHGPRCSEVEWSYYKTRSSSITKVSGGEVLDSRLTLNSDCSLSVPSVTVEDTGLFLCHQKCTTDADTNVFVNVLTEPKSQSFTLQCTLWRYDGRTCSAGTLVWLDQNQEVLSGEQRNCESYLTVELQSPHSRTFTCQYKEKGKVQVSAEYSLMRERVQPEKGWSWFLVLKTLSWTGLIITTVVVSICTRDGKRTKSNRKRVPDYENETDL